MKIILISDDGVNNVLFSEALYATLSAEKGTRVMISSIKTNLYGRFNWLEHNDSEYSRFLNTIQHEDSALSSDFLARSLNASRNHCDYAIISNFSNRYEYKSFLKYFRGNIITVKFNGTQLPNDLSSFKFRCTITPEKNVYEDAAALAKNI